MKGFGGNCCVVEQFGKNLELSSLVVSRVRSDLNYSLSARSYGVFLHSEVFFFLYSGRTLGSLEALIDFSRILRSRFSMYKRTFCLSK